MADYLGPLDLSSLTWTPQFRRVETRSEEDRYASKTLIEESEVVQYFIHGDLQDSNGEDYTFTQADNILGLYGIDREWYCLHPSYGGFFGYLKSIRVYKFEGDNKARVYVIVSVLGSNTTHQRGYDLSGLSSIENDWGI